MSVGVGLGRSSNVFPTSTRPRTDVRRLNGDIRKKHLPDIHGIASCYVGTNSMIDDGSCDEMEDEEDLGYQVYYSNVFINWWLY